MLNDEGNSVCLSDCEAIWFYWKCLEQSEEKKLENCEMFTASGLIAVQ